MTRPYVKNRLDKIIELATKHDLTSAEIAERFGCRSTTVASTLRKAGYSWSTDRGVWVRASVDRPTAQRRS